MESIMADHNIAISQHLLKRLEEEMNCLSSLMSQMNSLSSQVLFVSSGLKGTWTAIKTAKEEWKRDIEKH